MLVSFQKNVFEELTKSNSRITLLAYYNIQSKIDQLIKDWLKEAKHRIKTHLEEARAKAMKDL
jgi:hypothetical protein